MATSQNWKSWYDNNKYNYPQFFKYDTLAMLNIIGKTYQSALGYDIEESFFDSKLLSINIPGLYDIDEEEELALFDKTKAKELAESTLLTYRKIILRLAPVGEHVWEEIPNKVTKTWLSEKQVLKKPVYWYNFPFSREDALKPLSSRKYIRVNELFEEIQIDSQKKGSPITLDDVYFASRGLCIDDTRTYEGFYILSDDGSTLILRVDIDNWST